MDNELEAILNDAVEIVKASETIPDYVKEDFYNLVDLVRKNPSPGNVEVLDIVLEYFESLERTVENIAETDIALLETKLKQAERDVLSSLE